MMKYRVIDTGYSDNRGRWVNHFTIKIGNKTVAAFSSVENAEARVTSLEEQEPFEAMGYKWDYSTLEWVKL
jgi:hypothetical protein